MYVYNSIANTKEYALLCIKSCELTILSNFFPFSVFSASMYISSVWKMGFFILCFFFISRITQSVYFLNYKASLCEFVLTGLFHWVISLLSRQSKVYAMRSWRSSVRIWRKVKTSGRMWVTPRPPLPFVCLWINDNSAVFLVLCCS